MTCIPIATGMTELENGKKLLNLGCGELKEKGYINLDISPDVKPDVVCDIETQRLPFPDNYFDEIRAWRILEHITPDKLVFVLNEIARVSKPSCILDIIVPWDNTLNRAPIDHHRTFNWSSFWDLEDGRTGTPKIKLRLKRLNPLPPKWYRRLNYLFPFIQAEIRFKYEVIK